MLGMSEHPNGQPPPPVTTDTTAPFGFTFGESHTQKSWSDFRRLTWPQLVEMMTSHVPGPKDGSCIVPARFSGVRRIKEEATRIDVAFLDSDAGMTLPEIEAAVIRNGWEAVISSTHSHMSTRTKVKLSNWDKFFEKNPNGTPEQFLVEDKGYLPRIAADAMAAETTSEYVFIDHQPCPKFRVAIPLERPWLAANYDSQAEANAAWKGRIEALAGALGLAHDQACTDTSRLFYLPRRPPNGVVPETAVVAGAHCDIFALKTNEPDDLLSTAGHQPKPRQTEQFRETEYLDPISGEIIDLVAWAKAHGGRFLIAKALRKNKPGALTGHSPEGKVHIDCPNAAAHTDPGRDGATYVVNGGNGTTKGFVIHCRHAHCTDKDRLFFVRRMLDEGWLRAEDLTDPKLISEEDGQKEEAAKADHPKEPRHDAYQLVWFDEIQPGIDCNDFVQGVLVTESGAVVYGESNAGKTFWATDLALHVAAGLKWNGKRVDQRAVIYAALEGGLGFRNRVVAWRKKHKLEGQHIPFAAIQSSVNLLNPEADTVRLIEAIEAAAEQAAMPVGLVVIDTLSRSLAGGNENSPEDMGALVLNMDRIRSRTKACVLFIHHSGKDAAKGARGHSLLRAAIDTEIEVVAEEGSQTKTATVVKQRDLKKGDVFTFELEQVEIDKNRHGEMVTTCVVSGGEQAPGGASARRRLTGHNQRALEVLMDLVATSGRTGDRGVPPGLSAVPEKWWRERFYERAMAGAESKTKEKAFRRAADTLVSLRRVGLDQGRVWVVPASRFDVENGDVNGDKSGDN